MFTQMYFFLIIYMIKKKKKIHYRSLHITLTLSQSNQSRDKACEQDVMPTPHVQLIISVYLIYTQHALK